MKYRSRTGKTISDQSVLNSAGEGATQLLKRDRSSIGNIFISLYKFLIGMSAFIARGFLRSNLGERTFGIITIVSVYWIIWYLNISIEIFNELFEDLSEGYEHSFIFIVPAGIASFFLAPIWMVLALRDSDFKFPSLSDGTGLIILAVICTILALAHLIEAKRRHLRKEVIHSYYRGDSLLFGWMAGRSLWSQQVTPLHIWMIVEPLFVFLISVALLSFEDFYRLGGVLMISSFCLFIEEYHVYQENRQFILDMLDGRLDATFVGEIQEQYEEGLEIAQKSSPKDYKATFGQNKSKNEERGSSSPFRARIV